MNKDDFENAADEQLLKRIREAEQEYINNLEPSPAIKTNLRRQFAAPVPLWKKPVPAWAAAAAVLLFMVPALLLWMNKTTPPGVLVNVQTDTVRLRDTLRIVEYREKEPEPAGGNVTVQKQVPPQNAVAAVKKKDAQNRPAQADSDYALKAALLGVKVLPAALEVKGRTLADDTVYKNFIVTM